MRKSTGWAGGVQEITPSKNGHTCNFLQHLKNKTKNNTEQTEKKAFIAMYCSPPLVSMLGKPSQLPLDRAITSLRRQNRRNRQNMAKNDQHCQKRPNKGSTLTKIYIRLKYQFFCFCEYLLFFVFVLFFLRFLQHPCNIFRFGDVICPTGPLLRMAQRKYVR